ncbi:MAG TPA: Crp/Fnr family transcriptional regulator [Nitrospirota bacterium]|nr:Crp/Fnr family transcriptional regulator [Nitrospirota bacterium]
MTTIKEFLKSLPMFSSLSDTDLIILSDMAKEFVYKNGEYVFYEGDSPDWFCIVKEGNIKAIKQAEDGKEIIMHMFKAGDTFGDVAVFDRRPYPASALTVGQTTVIKFHHTHCFQILETMPEVAAKFLLTMGRKQREFVQRIEGALTSRVEKRIANTLLKLANMTDAELGKSINLHLTRKDIANMVGTTIETAIRVMSRFQKEGVIETNKSGITILKPDKLHEICGQEEDD